MNNLAITLDEIATASGIPKKEIIRLIVVPSNIPISKTKNIN